MARRIWINVESPVYATVRGHGARALLMTARPGRLPLWSSIGRCWNTTERTARDVVAIAERAGFDVIVTGEGPPPHQTSPPAPVTTTEAVGEHHEPDRPLW